MFHLLSRIEPARGGLEDAPRVGGISEATSAGPLLLTELPAVFGDGLVDEN
jgi:hypothetical protein